MSTGWQKSVVNAPPCELSATMCNSPLLQLPEALLLLIAAHLDEGDLRRFQGVCRFLRVICKPCWQRLLGSDYGLVVQAPNDPLYFTTYKTLRTHQQYAAGSIRFRGMYTDGGCDEALRQYGMDNCLQPALWESYCSAGELNVNIIGVFWKDAYEEDEEQRLHREYLINRLKGPLAGRPLEDISEAVWTYTVDERLREGVSTARLEHLVGRLYELIQPLHANLDHPMAFQMFEGVPLEKLSEEVARLDEVYRSRLRENADQSRHRQRIEVHPHPQDANKILDPQAVPRGPFGPCIGVAVRGGLLHIASWYVQLPCPVWHGVV
eukprot:jgi/Botrbrau1/3529/Bobra.341_2s0056.2